MFFGNLNLLLCFTVLVAVAVAKGSSSNLHIACEQALCLGKNSQERDAARLKACSQATCIRRFRIQLENNSPTLDKLNVME